MYVNCFNNRVEVFTSDIDITGINPLDCTDENIESDAIESNADIHHYY